MSDIKDRVVDSIKTSCKDLLGDTDFDIANTIEYSEGQFGDFALNVAFRLSKNLKKSPTNIASDIASLLNKSDMIEKCQVAGNGFVNITLKRQIWTGYLNNLKANFIRSDKFKGKTTQIEFISANPTGPLVLVNAWAGYFGDILGNILASQGYKVTREYYYNDGGNQVVNLGKTIQHKLGKKFSKKEQEEFYKGKYVDELAKKISLELGNDQKVIDANFYDIGKKATEILFESHVKPELTQLKIEFDSFFPESKLNNNKTLKRLEKLGAVKEYDNAIWLDGKKVGLEDDQVLVRSYDKGETYFLKDISYQLDKLENRKINQAIIILGPDHHGQAKRLIKTMEFLGFSNLHIMWTQTVRLIKGGKEFKMSKRAGNIILIEDFLSEIPSDVARFFFALRDINSHMDFDIDLAKKQSKNNPIYYLMYSYVRANSIIREAKKARLTKSSVINHELNEKELGLIKEISKIRDSVVKISTNYRVHNLLTQAIELARCFHDYYESETIIKLPKQEASSKLALIDKYIMVNEEIFKLIGISPMEKM
ncbi:MAG: arginine--tRNA ligase [bacterium]|nr:arginine--tRNA ligase [bacterium]